MHLHSRFYEQTLITGPIRRNEAAGKGDMLVVQRAGKGSLPTGVSEFLRGYQQLGQLQNELISGLRTGSMEAA